MNAIKSSWVIRCVNAELKINVSETRSVSIIRVNVRNNQKSLKHIPVSLNDASSLLACYATGGWSQLVQSPPPPPPISGSVPCCLTWSLILSVCRLVFACHCFFRPSWSLTCLILLKLSVSVVCNILMVGFHAWLSLNPFSLLMLFWLMYVQLAMCHSSIVLNHELHSLASSPVISQFKSHILVQ
jgi:hypothetical protein